MSERASDGLDARDLIDLEQYPIVDLDAAAGRALVARCREELADDGALSLAGFLAPGITRALAAEARGLTPLAYDIEEEHTVYFAPAESGFAQDHPRRRLLRSFKGGVAYDRFPPGADLRRLYEWEGLKDFIAAVLGEKTLFRHGDPMAALNLNVFREGQNLNWHFDRTDFSVTLSLQSAEAGGEFEYVPSTRTPDDESYDRVARLIDGDAAGIERLAFAPGTLALFRGHYSLHRVTPVRGPRPRLAAALSYVREEGVTFTPYARRLFYGREAPA